MKREIDIAVCTHIFWEDSWPIMKDIYANFEEYDYRLFFNLSRGLKWKDSLIGSITQDTKDPIIIESENRGRDIGGKIRCFESYLKSDVKSKYTIFLHDKRSTHLGFLADLWRSALFRIVRPNYIEGIIRRFEESPTVGIIGSKKCLDCALCGNEENILKICDEYEITPPPLGTSAQDCENRLFIAGTMFWIRTSILEEFFSNIEPWEIFSRLEAGNCNDNKASTFTHSWERIFGCIAKDQGYTLEGF